jgi:hypothetical protein
MPALWSTRPVVGPHLRRVVNLLFMQAGVGVAIALIDLRARGDVLGEHYGPPLLLIALELALSLAALLLAIAVRGGQRTALGPLVVLELAWFGAAAWAVLSGGGAAVGGAVIALLILARLADAQTRAEARALAPYDQQVMLAEEQGVGFTINTVPQPFGADAGWDPPTIAAPTRWGRRSTDRLPQ